MNETRWFLSEVDPTQVAMPYRHDTERGFVPCGHNGYLDWPAGQLRSTISEMARFLAVYMQEGQIGDRQALDPASIRVLAQWRGSDAACREERPPGELVS